MPGGGTQWDSASRRDFSVAIPLAKECPSARNSMDWTQYEWRQSRRPRRTGSRGPYRLMANLLIRPLTNFSSRVDTALNHERERVRGGLIALLWLMQRQHIFKTTQNSWGTTVSSQRESRKSKARALMSLNDTRRTLVAARLPTAVREAS